VTWPTVKLQEVCQLITDGVHNSPEYCDAGIPMLDSKHIGENFFIDDTKPEKFISLATDAILAARCKPSVNDVLISSRGSIGKIAIVGGSQNFNIMGNIILVRAANNILPRFLAYTLKNKVTHLVSIANGVAQKGLYLNQIRSLLIPLPSLAEQKRIAAILDKAEEIKRKREQAIAKLDALENSLFSNAFAATDYEKISINEMLNRNILLLHKDGNHGSLYPRSDEFGDEGIPFLTAKCIMDNGQIDNEKIEKLNEQTANKLKIGWILSGDVLLAHNASVGKVALYRGKFNKALIGTSLTAFRPNQTIITSQYLYSALRSSQFQSDLMRNMGQTTRNQVPITAQRELQLCIPPLQLQIKYAEKVKKIDHQRIKLLTSSKKISATISSLQQQAFTTGFNA